MSDCALLSTTGEVNYHNEHSLVDRTYVHSTSVTTVACDFPVPICTNAASTASKDMTVCEESNGALMDVHENYASDVEVPLRRSKRGKGRSSNNIAINTNSGVASDERVTSCTVGGVEYHTGDFVYYEEPDFEYFTIGLIEEIKFSRRDKFTVFVKCFYRTYDIPESTKQSVLERELFQSPSNAKLKNEVLLRELFVSEVQETLASKQLRGRCKVSHLCDLRTALNTFRPDEEDSFFYVFAYNPETRRLMHTRAEIRIGKEFQANIPSFRHLPPATYRRSRAYRFPHCSKHDRSHCGHPAASHKRRSASGVEQQSMSPDSGPHDELLKNEVVACDSDPVGPPKMFTASQYTISDSVGIRPCQVTLSDAQPNATCGVNLKVDENMTGLDAVKSPPTLENFGTVSTSDIPSVNSLRSSHHHCHHHHYRHRHRNPRRRRISGCPSLIDPVGHKLVSRRRGTRRRWETIKWRPHQLANSLSGASNWKNSEVGDLLDDGDLADEPLKTYLDAVRSMVAFFGFGGADDDDLASAENGLVLANLVVTIQHAYDTLHQSNYSLERALQHISYNPIPSKNTPRHWTADQVRLFAHALRVHGKDFHAIQRDFFGGQSTTTTTTASAAPANKSFRDSVNGFGTTGRSRGRGRRKGGVTGLRISSVKAEEDNSACKPNETKTSDDDGNNTQTTATRGSSNPVISVEPVKTVKELIAFYYYWKRKGAAASIGLAGGNSGNLNAAAVNFAAAVAAAANTESQTSGAIASTNGQAVNSNQIQQQQQPQQQHHPLAGNGKKRKQSSRNNALTRQAVLSLIESRKIAEGELRRKLALKYVNGRSTHISSLTPALAVNGTRTSTPTSEVSESAGTSLPDSEVEDVGDAGVEDSKSVESDSHSGTTRLVGTGSSDPSNADVTPSTRLRRRQCRNCGSDLSTLSELSHTSGVGQLRFLCPCCRIHLQKYGELKPTPTSTVTQLGNSDIPLPADDTVVADTNVDRLQPCDKDRAGSIHSTGSTAASPSHCSQSTLRCDSQTRGFRSPYSFHSPQLSSPCSVILGSEADHLSSSSSNSWSIDSAEWCGFSSSDSCSSETDAHSPLADNRHRRPRYAVNPCPTRRHAKRRRLPQSFVDSTSPVATVDRSSSLWHPATKLYDSSNGASPRLLGSAHSPAIPVPDRVPYLVGSFYSTRPDDIKLSSVLPESTLSVSETLSPTGRSMSKVSDSLHAQHTSPPVAEELIDSETEAELTALLNTPSVAPVPCWKEVHRSLWSRLLRVWDRSVQLTIPGETVRLMQNEGTCSRTDLIYHGRVDNLSDLTMARQQLYALHAETAVGPGTAVLEQKIPSSPQQSYEQTRCGDTFPSVSLPAPHPSTTTESMALNLSARQSQQQSPGRIGTVHSSTVTGHRPTAPGSLSFAVSNLHQPSTSRACSSHGTTSRTGSSLSTQSYDPSYTQQQIQAAYEQAMLLAAASSHPSYPSSQTTSGLPLSRDLHVSHGARSAATTHSSRTPQVACANSVGKQIQQIGPSSLSARLGAAAGTFYPPPLVTSANSIVSSPGRSNSSTHPLHPFSNMLHTQALLNAMSCGGSSNLGPANIGANFVPHHPLPPTSAHPLSFPTSALSMSAGVPIDSLWKNPEFLQRQLMLMGLIPPSSPAEQALLNAIDPREIETLRHLMAEKLNSHTRMTQCVGSGGLHEQQQELFAAAAATDLLMRGRSAVVGGACSTAGMDMSSFLTSAFPYPLPVGGSNSGAMTSAVNSISTRPTASVQSPHFRHPSLAPTTHIPPFSRHPYAQQQLHPGPDPHLISSNPACNISPPTAHATSNTPSPRPTVSAANYIPLFAGTPNASFSRLAPAPPTQQSSVVSLHSSNPAIAVRPPSTCTNSAQYLQEQMVHAAKLAVLAANMHSDPNKALNFAAALADLAAHEKALSQSNTLHSSQPHLGPSFQPLTKSSTSSISPFDFRGPGGGLHAESLGSIPSFSTDRRRSGPLGNQPVSPSVLLPQPQHTPIVPATSRRTPTLPSSVGHARHMANQQTSLPTTISGSNRLLSGTGLGLGSQFTPFNLSNVPSPAQLAQLNQLAQSAGLAPGLALHDPAVLNALTLAAAAAYAATPQQQQQPGDPLSFAQLHATEGSNLFDRHRFQNQTGTGTPSHRQTSNPSSHHHQQQQQAAAAAVAAAAAFASLPHLNLGPRLPSSSHC
ncbi:hypothetical protein PHET_04259 [Paragonimus heterotremus]|uniref:BAH domain-containing protein n=1 Tax=Paragonimus heterotremus TaxID=100268 RepID=A0A8J4SQC6_9TREM|nr:hypothetical protein PHET_04259 [Paragonimus heterotremus]